METLRAALAEQGDRAGVDRAGIDARTREMTHKVEGTGRLSVHVSAPHGTRVGAQGGGLFKKLEVHRQRQMEPADTSTVSQGLG